jgi:hypothetical protein
VTPTCPEVTYTVIARDMYTLAELGRSVQSGNGVTATLSSAFDFTSYTEPCIAVDVMTSDGSIIDDVAPNTRDVTEPAADLCDTGTGGQTWN